MRSRFFIIAQYLRYWFEAIDQYSLQTPFVYNFYNEVILGKVPLDAFEAIEQLRAQLLKDNTKIVVRDFGAGSVINAGSQRKIAAIAHHSLSSPKFSRFLFKAVQFSHPKNVVELGTSLGINTLYMAKAAPDTPIITLEGCTESIKIAEKHFKLLKAHHVRVVQGNIDATLPQVLSALEFVDFVYFDANHKKEATLRYFELCLKKVRSQTIFIFDDIHLSREMSDAWKTICENPAVSTSIDIFDAGIVFFRKGLTKGHYILEF